jgi:ABC-type microcin C transport system permease subunit YejB
VRNTDKKKPLRIARRRLEDNIKMDLGEIVWNVMDWIDLAHDKRPVEVMTIGFHKIL